MCAVNTREKVNRRKRRCRNQGKMMKIREEKTKKKAKMKMKKEKKDDQRKQINQTAKPERIGQIFLHNSEPEVKKCEEERKVKKSKQIY